MATRSAASEARRRRCALASARPLLAPRAAITSLVLAPLARSLTGRIAHAQEWLAQVTALKGQEVMRVMASSGCTLT